MNLQFGDHDGLGSEVLLQHPLGVLSGKGGQIYIADSYNHKVVSCCLSKHTRVNSCGNPAVDVTWKELSPVYGEYPYPNYASMASSYVDI